MTEIESADNNIPDDASSVYSEYVPSVHSSDEEDNVSSSCPSSCAQSDSESTDQYTKHDFPDLKITPGQLQRFNDAYEEFLEFVASAAGSTDREPMLLEKPNQLRPLPQTLQDFMVQMPLVNIGSAAVNHKNEIEKRLIRCVDMNAIKDRDCAEEVLKAERKQMDQQLTVFEAVCVGCDKVAHQQQWEKLFQLLLVSCTVLFDENAHLLFGQHSPVERVSDILNRLGKCWRAVFAQPHGVLKLVDESITTSLRKWLLSSQQDLNEGAYSEVGPHANPFRLVRFPFEPIKGEELNFDTSQPSSPKSKKSGGSGPKDGKTERPGGSVPAETPDLPGKKTLDRNDSTATFDLPDIQNPAATLARHNSWETKPSDFVVHPLTGVAIHEAIKKDDDDDDSDVEEVVDDDDEPVQREEDDIPITTPTAKETPPGSTNTSPSSKIFAKLSEIAQDEANPITKHMGQYLTAEESQAKTKPAKKRKRTYVAPWERGKEQPPAKQQPAPPQEQSQSSQNAALSRFLQTQQTLSNPPMPPVVQQQSRLAMQQQQQQQANAQQMVSQQLAQQQAMQQQAIQQQQQQAMQMNMMMAQQPMQFAMAQQPQFALPQVVMSPSAMNVLPMGAYLTQPMQQQASPAGTPQSQTQTYVQSPQFMYQEFHETAFIPHTSPLQHSHTTIQHQFQ